MIECLNNLLHDHQIDSHDLLNACIIEKFVYNDHIPDSPLLPDSLKNHISDESPVAILCLGKQTPIDVIPKFFSTSLCGKIDAGRIFTDHGSAILLSATVLKRYQIRSDLGFQCTSTIGSVGYDTN